jgi:hypothetical protein
MNAKRFSLDVQEKPPKKLTAADIDQQRRITMDQPKNTTKEGRVI